MRIASCSRTQLVGIAEGFYPRPNDTRIFMAYFMETTNSMKSFITQYIKFIHRVTNYTASLYELTIKRVSLNDAKSL